MYCTVALATTTVHVLQYRSSYEVATVASYRSLATTGTGSTPHTTGTGSYRYTVATVAPVAPGYRMVKLYSVLVA